MIPDHQTNTVYIADSSLQMKNISKILETLFQKNTVAYKILKSTKDINCRDYMPVQIKENDFVQFIYRPESYFEHSEYRYITDPVRTGLENNLIRPVYSRIILDGSNVVKWEDKVILTNKVLKDNRYQFDYEDRAIIKQLENIFRCRVIIIPGLPGDITGHAGSLLRFINAKQVFINSNNGISEEKLEWLEDFQRILIKNNLNPVELPCNIEKSKETTGGSYLDYLQVGKLIIVPVTGDRENDEKAITAIRSSFTGDYIIETIENLSVTKRKVKLNRMAWTIKS
jgi:agmatine deiminase